VRKLQERLRTVGARRDKGASAVEYGLLVALIAVVIAGAVWGLGSALSGKFGNVRDCVTADAPAATGGTTC
jgi:pilus assembly protein Flp/PilA